MKTRWIWLGMALVAGCGDSGSGFAGIYMVTSHSKNDTACDSPGQPVTGGPTFIRFKDQDFLGVSILSGRGCASAAETECTGSTGGISIGFLGPIDGAYGSDAVFNPTGTKEACTFNHVGTRVRHTGGKNVEIREEERQGTRAVKICDIGAEVDDNLSEEGRTLPCKKLEVMTLIEL